MPRLVDRTGAGRRFTAAVSNRPRRLYSFVDVFSDVHGTLPEKMVYAELSRLGIPFYFLNDMRFEIPEIELVKDYQTDFFIPAIKLIIEVQGAYFHSMEKTIEADAFKFAVYEAAGYRVLAWWDYDILSRLHDLIIAEPSLLALAKPSSSVLTTELTPIKRTKIDTSKGIRTLNSRRKRQKSPTEFRRKLRKARLSYAS